MKKMFECSIGRMSKPRKLLLVTACLSSFSAVPAYADPPFRGTIFIDSDIVTSADPTSFESAEYIGRGNRGMFDRRTQSFGTYNAYLFRMKFDDGLQSEAQVNPEFGSVEAAREQVLRHAVAIGQIPTRLRRDVDKIWIHRGPQLYGGGNRSILIHTDQSTSYERGGILEEVLIHEAAHTSLQEYDGSQGWLAAKNSDPDFISTYARDNPTSEDVAESFVPYLAVRYRRDRISGSLADTINQTIPNRIAFFDTLALDLYPIAARPTAPAATQVSSPVPGSTLPGTRAVFQWNRSQGATSFDFIAGTTGPGASDLRRSSVFDSTQITLDNLPTNGSTVYARLWTFNNGWKYQDYTYTAASGNQARAALQGRQTGTVLNGSSTNFAWNAPDGARSYDLIVGSGGPGANDIRASRVTGSNGVTVSGIPENGQLVYARLWTYVDDWKFLDYVFTSNNASSQARLRSPAPGSSPRTPGVTFSWSQPNGVTNFDLYVGTGGPGTTDIRAPQVVRGTSLRLNNMPTDGRKVYVRFWSYENGWKFSDYVY